MEFGHSNAFGPEAELFQRNATGARGWPQQYAHSIINKYSLQDGEFHIYTCIWDENRIAMYVDMDKYPEQGLITPWISRATSPTTSGRRATTSHKGQLHTLQYGRGRQFPRHPRRGRLGTNDANGQEASMYVNYVKIYQKGTPDETLFTLAPGDVAGVSAVESAATWRMAAGEIIADEAVDMALYDLSGRCVVSASLAVTMSLAGVQPGCMCSRVGSATAKIAVRRIPCRIFLRNETHYSTGLCHSHGFHGLCRNNLPAHFDATAYRLAWSDEFDGTALDRDTWNVEDNGTGCGNNELQYYIDSPSTVSVADGCLVLTARRQDYGDSHKFVSGRINSCGMKAFTYGIVEAAIKLPATSDGLWPALRMMGNDISINGWPACGEVRHLGDGTCRRYCLRQQRKLFNGAVHYGPRRRPPSPAGRGRAD